MVIRFTEKQAKQYLTQRQLGLAEPKTKKKRNVIPKKPKQKESEIVLLHYDNGMYKGEHITLEEFRRRSIKIQG